MIDLLTNPPRRPVLQHPRQRYYSPSLGRWINRDPVGEKGGLNTYAFTQNDTINQYDYLGLELAPGKWGNP